MLIYICSIF